VNSLSVTDSGTRSLNQGCLLWASLPTSEPACPSDPGYKAFKNHARLLAPCIEPPRRRAAYGFPRFVSSHCTIVSRSVRSRGASVGHLYSKDGFEGWESMPEWHLCPSLFEPFARHAQGYLPRLVRASKARACMLGLGFFGKDPSRHSQQLSLFVTAGFWSHFSFHPFPRQDTGELNFVGWYKSLAGSSVVLSAAWRFLKSGRCTASGRIPGRAS